ncbi:MAG: cAMP-activated global transcriptional regulator CRP [Methylomonas sp.]|nr:cAMP-activated global transcriptional regulator CRP [Methylomonas sp.]PPD20135.1 MAG: cAMP-activated global transcriptional regulator CRP [Methylomonas sp.]PPD37928.1 MAG: cAMP-activated global transcriptional regulator CRP [Methylomonas sp.]PPD52127.1 MAG: cAMP-activated global transcriptional regulator CRP [Methylomonas sp.]
MNPVNKSNKISPAALDAFLHYCHVRAYPAKLTVVRPGDVGDKLLFVVDGSVSVSVEDEDGHELILAYLNKHDFVGEIGVFKATEARSAYVKTRTKCQLAEIGYERFKLLLNGELRIHAVEILTVLGEQLSSRLLITSRKYRDLAFMDVEGRIARALLDLTKEPDAMTHPDGMQLYITRQEIGRIVGCSREMAGRVLKELEDKGLITARGKTIVVFGAR